jgi:3-oxoacyl-[acyl-carrier-protein] synthase-3
MRTDLYISGLGTYVPETLSVASAVEQGLYPKEKAERDGWVGASVAGEVPAPEMALQAAQEAFKRADLDPQSVDLLLYADCWHQGPDGWQPQYYLQHHLVGGDVLAVELRHGCAGLFSGFQLAASYLAADPARTGALLVSSDNVGTPLIDRWNLGPGFIAGDGAAAAVLTKEPGFARLLSVTSTSMPAFEEVHRAGEPLFPPGITVGRTVDYDQRLAAFRRQKLAEGGTAESMNGALAFEQRARGCLAQTLAEAGIELTDVTRVATTNSSREEVEDRFMGPLKLPVEMSTWDFGRTVGHLGAADQLVSIDHLLTTGQLGAGDHVLMLSLAPGITFSCAVVQIVSVPSWAGRPPA